MGKKPIAIISAVLNPASKNIMKMLEKGHGLWFIDSFGVHEKNRASFQVTGKRGVLGKALYALSAAKSIAWFLANRGRFEAVIGISEPNWFLLPFFFAAGNGIRKIFFPYDIAHFRPKCGGAKRRLELFCEERNFLLADLIIHKGLKDELSLLPFSEKIAKKPSHLFREFFDSGLMHGAEAEKLSKIDGQAHIAYAGGIYAEGTPDTESFFKFCKRITGQRLHLHVYSKVPKETEKRLRDIEKSDRYFHYEGFFPHEELVKELAKHDWGIHAFGNGSLCGGMMLKTAFANKNYDYLAAGIPIICSCNLLAVSEFVRECGIGFCIEYGKLEKLGVILEGQDYGKFMPAIGRATEKLADSEKFVKFVDKT